MLVLPLQTKRIREGDSVADALLNAAQMHDGLRDGDIVAVSSKVLATAEGAVVKLSNIVTSPEAEEWSEEHGRSAAFLQAVLDETKRMNGQVISSNHGVMLTELKPNGMEDGVLLVPNAGLDESNIEEGFAVGWPHDPVESAEALQEAISAGSNDATADRVAIIVTDSGLSPRRRGVVAFALACVGVDPIVSLAGTHDLVGKELKVTEEARADQLATAANAVMGNGNGATPAAIIRDHGFPLSDFAGWVPVIERERDIYAGVL